MRINKDYWLFKNPVAHRGLWGGNVAENSLPAYELAARKGYPIEIDLYLTADGKLVSFHDKTLKRATGADGFVYEKTLDELKRLNLFNGDFKIPTFDEVLKLAENKTPLLIEIKPQPNAKVVDEVVKRLKKYDGEFAIQSFNPLFLYRVKKLAPEFIRGILGAEKEKVKEGALKNFVVEKMPLNFLIKPDFISYSYSGLPIKEKRELPVIAWTVTDQKTADRIKGFADNIIFENFIPEN